MSSSSVELTKIGSKVDDILTSLVKMLEEDKQKEKELMVSLIFLETGCFCIDKMLYLIILSYGHGGHIWFVTWRLDRAIQIQAVTRVSVFLFC